MKRSLKMKRGARFRFRHEPHELLQVDGPRALLKRLTDGAWIETTVGEIVIDASYRRLDGDVSDHDLPDVPPSTLWECVPEGERTRALAREELVLLLLTGYRSGSPERAQGGEPYPGLDPRRVRSIKKRTKNLADRLARANDPCAVSARELERWMRRYGTPKRPGQGVWGLVDQRRVRLPSALAKQDERWLATITELFAEESEASTHTRSWYYDRAKERVDKRYGEGVVKPPGRSQFYELWSLLSRGTGASGTAQARRTARRARTPSESPTRPIRPTAIQGFDVTWVDALFIDDATGNLVRAELGVNLDQYSKSVLAGRFAEVSFNGIDAAFLLYDTLRPRFAPPGLPPEAYWHYGGCADVVL